MSAKKHTHYKIRVKAPLSVGAFDFRVNATYTIKAAVRAALIEEHGEAMLAHDQAL